MTTRARHVDATHPEKVTLMAATGRVKDGQVTIRTVCMVCNTVIVEGPTKDGHSSHGLCGHADCERITTEPVDEHVVRRMANLSEIAYGRYMAAPGDGSDKPAIVAFEKWSRCNRRFLTALRFLATKEGRAPMGVGTPAVPGGTPDSRNLAGGPAESKVEGEVSDG